MSELKKKKKKGIMFFDFVLTLKVVFREIFKSSNNNLCCRLKFLSRKKLNSYGKKKLTYS